MTYILIDEDECDSKEISVNYAHD